MSMGGYAYFVLDIQLILSTYAGTHSLTPSTLPLPPYIPISQYFPYQGLS